MRRSKTHRWVPFEVRVLRFIIKLRVLTLVSRAVGNLIGVERIASSESGATQPLRFTFDEDFFLGDRRATREQVTGCHRRKLESIFLYHEIRKFIRKEGRKGNFFFSLDDWVFLVPGVSTIIANCPGQPTASDAPQAPSQTTPGFVPLSSLRQFRRNIPQSPALPLPGV